MFTYRFDWQCDEDPPDVYIDSPEGYEMLRVFEQPKYIGGDESEKTSWRLGPFAESVLRAINVAHSAGCIVLEAEGRTNPGQDDVHVSEGIVEGVWDAFKTHFDRMCQPSSTRGELAGGTDDE